MIRFTNFRLLMKNFILYFLACDKLGYSTGEYVSDDLFTEGILKLF